MSDVLLTLAAVASAAGVGMLILLGVAETVVMFEERAERRTREFLIDPSKRSERDARLMNELARHYDELEDGDR